MNERIRLLAEQATKQVTKPDGHYIVQEWQKVFAELIVQECASIVYQTCRDGDAGAQAILYEFDIDNARSQK